MADEIGDTNIITGNSMHSTSGTNEDDNRGNGADTITAADPASFVKRGRGRHPNDCTCDKCNAKRSGTTGVNNADSGRGNRKSSTSTPDLDLGGLALQLQGVHKLAVLFTKNEIWNISDDEAKKMAQAIKNVLKHHNIPISPVVLAYLQLGGVSLAIYGPRVGIMMAVKKMQQQQAAKEAELATANSTVQMVAPSGTMQ